MLALVKHGVIWNLLLFYIFSFILLFVYMKHIQQCCNEIVKTIFNAFLNMTLNFFILLNTNFCVRIRLVLALGMEFAAKQCFML